MTTQAAARQPLEKSPTGIAGLDEITGGGLPKGRPTLVCGAAGCGKTLFGITFLVNGAVTYGEPGVFIAFDETAEDLAKNVLSLGFDLDRLAEQNKMVVDYVRVERCEIEEVGEYNLDGLFIRLGQAIDSIGAKRLVLDTLETLFSGLTNPDILRAELRRLFHWLKDRGITAVITAERGKDALTRHGIEEYVSDCVIALDHRVTDQLAIRTLRVVKYRGSAHGTNDYPFLITDVGFEVQAITSVGLDHAVSSERIPTGIGRLDTMLGGGGYYRGSSILVSGTTGAGKSTVAAIFADAACRRGEKVAYFAFEESKNQIVRNMKSIDIDLEPHVASGLLVFHAARPTSQGLETHLAAIHRAVRDHNPQVVILDPITNFIAVGSLAQVHSMVIRMVDFLKSHQITSVFTSLTYGSGNLENTDVGLSSLIDTWLLLKAIEVDGERNRVLYLLKSRGMAHSNQVREFLITSSGLDLVDVYIGSEGVLTGSARLAQEARDRADQIVIESETLRTQRSIGRKRQSLEAQIAVLQATLDEEADILQQASSEANGRLVVLAKSRNEMATKRKADLISITGE